MKKKNVIKLVCAVCALAVCVGSFAFFTDRLTADSTAKAGNIDLVFTDISDGTSENEFAVEKAWDSETGVVSENQIINPGDTFDLSYNLQNKGNKSIDVDQQITLKLTDDTAAYVEDDILTNAQEYALHITGGKDTDEIIPTYDAGTKTLTYDLTYITLNGVGDGAETEEDGNAIGAATVDYDVTLEFDIGAKNAFMDSDIEINLYAQAKQHRNTAQGEAGAVADWNNDWTVLANVEQIN